MTRQILTTGRTAAYLRCYPYDQWGMETHRLALQEHAAQLNLPEPAVHLDNGIRSSCRLPELERLLMMVARGYYDVILVPGPFVFHIDDRAAAHVIRRITGHGARIVEMPGRLSTWTHRDRFVGVSGV